MVGPLSRLQCFSTWQSTAQKSGPGPLGGKKVNVSVIFKIAGIGICIALLNQILIKSGKEEMAMMTTLAGVIIVLVIIVKMLAEFFDTIKVFMQF